MIATMTAATHANKNAFMMTASRFFGNHIRLYAIFISDRLNGQLVSTIAKHVSPITDSIASMFFVDRM